MKKKKIVLEFDDIHASPNLLFRYLSNIGNLSEWFADNVESSDEVKFSFEWDGVVEEATLVDIGMDEFIRFKWDEDKDEEEDYYLEFRLVIDDLTNDLSLVVTDFAEPDEVEDAKLLWESQINDLKHLLGC